MNDPNLDVRIGTEGITVALAVDVTTLMSWPRERYMLLMEAIGQMTDAVLQPLDPEQYPLSLVAAADSSLGTVGASVEDLRAAQAIGQQQSTAFHQAVDDELTAEGPPGDLVEFPPAPLSTPPDEPPTPSDPPASEDEDDVGFDQLEADDIALLRFLDDHHGGVDDDRGFAARPITEGLNWKHPRVSATINRCEAQAFVTVERDGRRMNRIEITDEGRARIGS